MTEVVAVEVHAGPAAPTVDETEMTVIVKMRFSQREVDEGLDYGVTVILYQHFPNAQFVVSNSAMTSMLVEFIPEKVPAPKFTSGAMTIKPSGPGIIRSVRFPFKLSTTDFPSGTALQAVATVVPEISSVTHRSAPAPVPSAAPLAFPTKVFDEKEN